MMGTRALLCRRDEDIITGLYVRVTGLISIVSPGPGLS